MIFCLQVSKSERKVSCFWQTQDIVRFRSPRCRGGKISRQINPDNNKSILVGQHSATTWDAHHVWSVAMQREFRLSAVRKRRDRALSTLLACRQSSTVLRVLLVNNAEYEDEKLRKLLTRRSHLMMRSFNLQEWSQDGSVRKFRFRSADISQKTKLLTLPVECVTIKYTRSYAA
jgi:hypothetical protein